MNISYSIPSYDIYKTIQVSNYDCCTIYNIQKAIAVDLDINENCFQIINPPSEKKIASSPFYLNLELKIINCIHDIELYINYDKVIIKNGYKMNFTEIIIALQNEGFFFSDSCIKSNLCLFISKKKKSTCELPFFAISKYDFVEFKLLGDIVTMECCGIKFFFKSFETGSDVYKLFEKCFEGVDEIKIYNAKSNIKLHKRDFIFKGYKYKIKIKYEIQICYFGEDDESFLYFEYLPTVLNLKKSIANLYKKEIKKITPDNIAIYNNDEIKILDLNLPLPKIQSVYDTFYYKLKKTKAKNKKSEKHKSKSKIFEKEENQVIDSIYTEKHEENKIENMIKSPMLPNSMTTDSKITEPIINSFNPKESPDMFDSKVQENLTSALDDEEKNHDIGYNENDRNVVDKKEETIISMIIFIEIKTADCKQNSILRKELPVETTIEEIEQMINSEKNIQSKINIKYKSESHHIIDPKLTLKDILEKLKHDKNKVHYYIYADVEQSKEMKEKPDLMDKMKTYDDYDSNNFSKTINVSKEINPKKKKIETYSDDDINNDIKKWKKTKQANVNRDSNEKEPTKEKESKIDISTSKVDKPKLHMENVSNDECSNVESENITKSKISCEIGESEKADTKYVPCIDKPTKVEIHKTKKTEDRTDDDNKLKKPKKFVSISKFKPTIKEYVTSSVSKAKNALNEYVFLYDDEKKTLNITEDSTLESNEKKIKKEFDIKSDEDIEFNIQTEEGKEQKIINKNQPMKTFIKSTIIINNRSIYKEQEKEKGNPRLITYHYQTNKNNTIVDIELNEDATVKTMKEEIVSRNEATNTSNVKILFAGKDLLDEIVLESLEIGDTTLFVYIRSEEDILLMTAKALKVDDYSYEYIEEEEDI